MQIDVDLGERAAGVDVHAVRPQSGRRAMTQLGRFGKYAVDFVLALIGTLCLLPVLCMVAVLIKLDSPGPVFFHQKRAGQGGRLFSIYKFRTMVHGAYKMGSRLTVKRDPRITRLGKLLRWSKIDELPQLFNVLRGEMSLIGPRPEDPHFVEFYTPAQRLVLELRPGIVGPSQIRGRDEVEDYPDGLKDTEQYYIEHILPPKLARDLEYVETATFWGDMGLLVRGLWTTVRGAFRAKYLWRRRRRLALMGADLTMAIATYLIAFSIRFDWEWPNASYLWQTLLMIIVLRLPLSIYFGVYQGIVSYFGLWDLIALFKAVTVGSLALGAMTYFVGAQSHPRSVFVIDWALLLFTLSGMRVALRAWTRRHPRQRWQMRDRAIIVGAGSGGEHISRALLEDPSAGYVPVGFIDESHERWGSRIHGVKVLGGIAQLQLAISANSVRTVFVCLSDLPDQAVQEVVEICTSSGIEYRLLPGLSELLNAENFRSEGSGLQIRAVDAQVEVRV